MATNHGVGGSNPSSPTTGPKGKDLSFTSGGKKIMIGIAGAKLLNLGMVFCRNGMALLFLFILSGRLIKLHIVILMESAYLCFTPRNSSSGQAWAE